MSVDDNKAKEFLLRLIKSKTASEVEKIINEEPVKNSIEWKPYGNNWGNFSIINNVTRDPVRALIEKPINSIDALLLKECKKKKINPESADAPKSMKEAIELFFGIKDGDISNLESLPKKDADKTIRDIAKNIRIFAEGYLNRPTITVVDTGEGQHPDDFPNTLLSLQQRNKIKIKFVQGKFNMGGSGAMSFCKDGGYQLVLSRKTKELLDNGKQDRWGFTLVRYHRPVAEEGDKFGWYEFAVDKPSEKIFSFPGCQLKILPNLDVINPGSEIFESGCLVKLFDYDLKNPSMVQRDLWRDINANLVSTPLPILIQETRLREKENEDKETGFFVKRGSDYQYIKGNRTRALKESSSLVNKHWFREAELGEFKKRKIEIIVFNDKDDKGRPFSKNSFTIEEQVIFLTVNGQTHWTFRRGFLERIGFPYLKDYILIFIDLSDVGELLNDIFMPNRSDVREATEFRKFEERLTTELKEDPILQELEQEYRRKELEKSQPDEGQIKRILQELILKNPMLSKFFGLGTEIRLPEPSGPEQPKTPFQGSYIPTYLRVKNFKETRSVSTYKKSTPMNRYTIVRLETDAQNDYLTRETDGGEFIFEHNNNPKMCEIGVGLKDGIIPLVIQPTKNARIYQTEFITVKLTRPNMEPLSVQLAIDLGPVVAPKTNPVGSPKKPKGKGFALPNSRRVFKDQWSERGEDGWTENDISEVKGIAPNIDIYVNMDSLPLKTFIENYRNRDAETEKQIRDAYFASIVLFSFVLHTKLEKMDLQNKNQIFSETMKSVGDIILPIMYTKKLALE